MSARAFAAIAASVLVASCAQVPTMEPDAIIVHVVPFEVDKEACRAHVLADKSGGLKAGSIAGKGGAVAAINLPSAFPMKSFNGFNPVVIAAGGVGGAAAELAEELGATDVRHQRMFVKCLTLTTLRDGSAIVDEPDPVQ